MLLKMQLKGDNVFEKAWYLLRRYILTLKVFDIFLQGTFLITILLEGNAYLLLRRDDDGSYTPSIVEDWMIIGAGMAEFLLGAMVAWWGGGVRNFALAGWLLAASTSGLLVLAFPFNEESPGDVELCGQTSLSSVVTDPNLAYRSATLVATILFCTFAKVSVWAHGLTYLDDHNPQNGPYFYGILISIRLSLGLSGQNWLIASSRVEDWWKSHLSVCMLTLMFAILFVLFPKTMEDFPESSPVRSSFMSSMNRLRTNRRLVLQTMALSLLSFGVFGFVHYEKAYVQARYTVESYRQDPQTSRTVSDIFRSLVIIFFVMIFRIRFSLCRSDGVKATTASRVGGVAAAVSGVLLTALAAISCDGGFGGDFQQPDCSLDCGCNSARYGMSPVCDLNTSTTYFSPCHAGCKDFVDLNGILVFGDCSCGVGVMVRGACSVGGCRTAFGAYQILYTVMLAVTASSLMMQGMSILRSVPRVDKPVAVGAAFAVAAFFTYVLGHVLYMGLSYLTCVFPVGYSCGLHGNSLWSLVASSAVLAGASAALSLYVSTIKADEPTTEL